LITSQVDPQIPQQTEYIRSVLPRTSPTVAGRADASSDYAAQKKAGRLLGPEAGASGAGPPYRDEVVELVCWVTRFGSELMISNSMNHV
jgi:hypothetical protein